MFFFTFLNHLDMSDQAEQDGTVGQKAEEPSMPVFHVYKFVCDFMAQNGWYVLFAIAVLCLLKKNLDSYFQVCFKKLLNRANFG